MKEGIPLQKEIWVALIQNVPMIVLFLGVAVIVYRYREPFTQHLLPRLSTVKLPGGLEFNFSEAKQQLDEAVQQRELLGVSEGDKMSAIVRARHVLPALQGAQVLWVDDDPVGNRVVRQILTRWGVFIDIATSTEEAVLLLRRYGEQPNGYHLVIYDIKRRELDKAHGDLRENQRAGLQLLETTMSNEKLFRFTIFYVLNLDPNMGVPKGAFAITNRPDHLLHYVMDALERERWK